MSGFRRVVIDRFGGPEELHVVSEGCLPEPGPGDVRLRLLACGVGYTDTLVRRGKYMEYRGGTPMTPGYDVVGMVDSVGVGVDVPTGSIVADMTVTGGYAQYMTRPAAGLIPVPAGVTPAQAVCVPLIWMTAWQMLTGYRQPQPGETVLVVGAAGSTGRALVALARYLNLKVVGSCSERDMDAVRSLGASPVDYRTADLAGAIMAAAGGEPVSMAFDAAAGRSWDVSWQILGKGGILIAYGAESMFDDGKSFLQTGWHFAKMLVGRNLAGRSDGTGRRVIMYLITARRKKDPARYLADASALLGLIADGRIAPAIAQILPFSAVGLAHCRIADGGVAGRIVLDPWAE